MVCPIDRGPLELIEWESTPAPLAAEPLVRIRRLGLHPDRFEREVRSGLLLNRRRRLFYPIVEGVPRMLIFPTGVVRDWVSGNRVRLQREFPGFVPPAEKGTPGEEAVLRTFSTEWRNYGWDERNYWGQSAGDLFRSMDFVLDLEHKDLNDRLVLEVGIGIGGIADHVARTKQCELIGIDLSYAVDGAFEHFSGNPFFHIAQASVFAPPFADDQFDFVYSQGVIHHTYSTQAAFTSIAKLPKPGGRLYIWVYSRFDEERTRLRKALFAIEGVVRPVYSRLPDPLQTAALMPWAPLYMLHQKLQSRNNPHQTPYSWRDAMHAARDRWTPRYVHRHTDQQVKRWFTAAGFDELSVLSERDAPDYVPEALVACVGVEGTRRGG